ncbi:MAG: glycosyltransferase [Thermoanaerobaculia bacterium]
MEAARKGLAILGPAPPDRGGIAHETSLLARELARRVPVDYVTFSRPYPRWLDPRRYAQDPALPASPARPLLDYRSPRTWKATARHVAGQSPGALLVPWWTAFWGVPVGRVFRELARLAPDVSRVLLCHNVEDHEGASWKRRLSRPAFAAATAYIAHWQEGARRISSGFPGRPVAVLPLPVPPRAPMGRESARRTLRLEPEGPLLLFIGLIRPYKGVDVLLAAAPRIVAETGARIAIVGEVFRAARGLDRMREASAVRERILWRDRYVSEEEMALWLAAADAVVLPYTRISASAIAARALGARRPIVASAVGGLRETVVPGVTGELFPARDPEALAGAVATVLSRGAMAYESGLAAAARRASWKNYAEGILDFVESVRQEGDAP